MDVSSLQVEKDGVFYDVYPVSGNIVLAGRILYSKEPIYYK